MRLDEIAQQPAVDRQAILAELIKLNIANNSTINEDGTVDVNGDVILLRTSEQIPVQFRNVRGDFSCSGAQITSLKGSPMHVSNAFICSRTKITSLEHAPNYVGTAFSCSDTEITSLQHSPRHVGGDFWCKSTKITSFQYAPKYIGGSFFSRRASVSSLHNIHKTNSDWVINDVLYLPDNCTHLLGLAYIPGVKYVQLPNTKSTTIVIHDVFEWQEKLLELGLVEQAQL